MKRSFITIGLGALVLFAAVVAVVMVLAIRPENKLGLRGGLRIEADPGTDVYIGNKHVGTGSVELTWDELLGTPDLRALATAITSVVPLPSTDVAHFPVVVGGGACRLSYQLPAEVPRLR